jgi:hypothetical protein
MRTVPFQSVYESVARRHGLDPFGDAIHSDTARQIAEKVTDRALIAWQSWDFAELTRTEERAFRPVWNGTDQYLRVSEEGLPDEVFYLVNSKYYRVKAAAVSDPPASTLPTNATYFEEITPEPFIALDQRCRRSIGQVLGVYSGDPSFNTQAGIDLALPFRPSEHGIRVMGGYGATVFVWYMLPPPEYTIAPYITGKTYNRGDRVFYGKPVGDGNCYRALTVTTNAPTNTATWTLEPVPVSLRKYLEAGAYSDCLRDTIFNGVDEQTRALRMQAAAGEAEAHITRLIDNLIGQGQKHFYGGSRMWSSQPWGGDRVWTLTDACDDDTLYPPVPPPIPIPDDTQSGVTPLVNGQDYIDVVFGSAQPNANWTFLEARIINTTDVSALNIWPGIVTIKTTTGFRLQLNGTPDTANYYLSWTIVGVPPLPATTYSLSGPTTGDVGVASTAFTVQLPAGQTVPGTVTVTPSDGGAGGTFTPSSVPLTTGSPLATFTYTPASAGAKTISVTNSGGLTNPGNLTYTAVSPLHLLNTLISYWKLDEASGTRNDSQGTNHLPAVNAPGSAAGKINNGAAFVRASAQGLQIANNASLQVTGAFTFSLWVKLTAHAGLSYILAKTGAPGSHDYGLAYDPAGPGFECWLSTAAVASDFAVQGSTTADNVWTHILFWYDPGDGQVRIRINDTTTYASTTSPGLAQTTSPFFVGGGNTLFSDAIIDEVGFWKRLLTAQEKTALYNGGAALAYGSFTT